MALTPEQIKKYREAYGFDAPEGQETAQAPDQVAQERIQRLKEAAATPAATVGAMGPTGPDQGQTTPTPPKSVFGKVLDFGKTVAKDAAESLLVKPAARAAEAVGRTGVLGDDIKRGYEVMNDEGGQNLKTPIGSYNIKAVKTGTEGAGQIAGEALKAGSYLYGGQGAGQVATAFGRKAAGSAIVRAATAGAASGGMYGTGNALEEGKDGMDVAKEGLMGAAIGGLAGGTIAAVPSVVKGAMGATKAVFGGAKRAVGALDDAGARAAELGAKSPMARKAINAGVDDNIVNFVETATPDDQHAFREMFSLAEKGANDLRFRTQAKQVAGKTLLDRADHLIKVKDIGVGQTNRVLNSLDQSPVDVSTVLYTFLDDLRGKGVTVVKRGNGYQMVSHGAVPEGDLGAYRTMLNIIAPEDGKTLRSFRGLHAGRQRIFNELNLAKARQQTFSDDVVRYADHFRALLAEPIDAASKGKYHAAQLKTAEAMGSLRDFVTLIGYKGDLEKLTTKDLKAAEVASRILGNSADRPLSVIQKLEETATKYGYKGNGTVMDQIQFADLLEDVFGTTQSRSFRGQVGRGTLDAASEVTGAAHDAASGNILALGGRAIKAMIGKSKDDQIIALKELVQGVGTPKTVFGKTATAAATAPAAKVAATVAKAPASAAKMAVPKVGPTVSGAPAKVLTPVEKVKFAEKTIADHLQESTDVINNLPPEYFKKDGGMAELIKRTQTNIADGIEGEGYKDVADVIRKVSPAAYKTLADYTAALRTAVRAAIK